MHAVKIADCHNGAMQWPNIEVMLAGVRGVEAVDRLVHEAIRLFAIVSVKACSISRRAVFVGGNMVTGRLTKFQINGLFKSRC
ncbi:MAG: hypothetical protein WDN48_17960 [Pseudolabrys sp.]